MHDVGSFPAGVTDIAQADDDRVEISIAVSDPTEAGVSVTDRAATTPLPFLRQRRCGTVWDTGLVGSSCHGSVRLSPTPSRGAGVELRPARPHPCAGVAACCLRLLEAARSVFAFLGIVCAASDFVRFATDDFPGAAARVWGLA